MGFFRKKKHRSRPRWMDDMIFLPVNRLLGRIRHSVRYEGRVRLANRWARAHPKRLWTIYCLTAIVLIFFNLVPFGFPDSGADPNDPLRLSGLAPIDNRLEFLDKFNTRQDILREEISRFGERGLLIAHEIDSLKNLPVKTRSDSVRIANLYQILNSTINTNTPHGHKKN